MRWWIIILSFLLSSCLLVPEDESLNPPDPALCISLHADWWARKIRAQNLDLPFTEMPPSCIPPEPTY